VREYLGEMGAKDEEEASSKSGEEDGEEEATKKKDYVGDLKFVDIKEEWTILRFSTPSSAQALCDSVSSTNPIKIGDEVTVAECEVVGGEEQEELKESMRRALTSQLNNHNKKSKRQRQRR